MLKNIITLITFILMIFSSSSSALADGGVFKSIDNGFWHLFKEDKQVCFINYKDGIQKMLISVQLNDNFEEEKALWLFPIPAQQNEAKIDILKAAPIFNGYNFEIIIKTKLVECFDWLYYTQIYPIPPIQARGDALASAQGGFQILYTLTKFGLTTELISAKNKQVFTEYLKTHKITFPDKFNKLLDEYIQKDYIFVISWLSNSEEYKKSKTFPIEVFITFKTPKMFFPLKLSSIYDNLKIPIIIYVVNFVTPDLFENIISKTKIEHFILFEYIPPNNLLDFFFNINKIEDFKYTKISIDSPANDLNQDLWISNQEPPRITLLTKLYDNTNSFIIFLVILISAISSLISSLLIFHKHKPNNIFFLILGASNLFSILGLIVFTYSININKFLSIKLPQFNKKTKYSHVLFNALFWALVFAALTISFGSSRFISPIEYIKAYFIYLTVFFLFTTLCKTLWWLNYKLALFIATFSLIFMILTYYTDYLINSYLFTI